MHLLVLWLRRIGASTVAAILLLFGSLTAFQEPSNLEHPSIDYYKSTPSDSIARLQQLLERGERRLQKEQGQGYLKSLLAALDIDPSSQILVTTKTSLQKGLISPSTPRAIYFNDDTYVAWVQDSPVIELSAVDPRLGATFYTLEQDSKDMAAPALTREFDLCVQCHDPAAPGHIMLSIIPDEAGFPVLHDAVFVTTDHSPWSERWGGWYVTGTHRGPAHLGNLIIKEDSGPRSAAAIREAIEQRHNTLTTDLSAYFDTTKYLTEHSDIVALMVMGHQVHAQNVMTELGYAARIASGDWKAKADELVEALLFQGETPLDGPVAGASGFASEFQRRGPVDSHGRSLRTLDLSRRLFRYPLSYLIYSRAFMELPLDVKEYVNGRLMSILRGGGAGEFAHLSESDRTAILEILRETHPDFRVWSER